MKKMILLVGGFAVVLAGVCGSTYLFAQGGTQPPPAAQQGTKVAVINIGQVFNQYKRAIAFKLDLEATLEPFKKKAKVLTDQAKEWEDRLRSGVPYKQGEGAEMYQNGIVKNKRDLEDMSKEIQKHLGEKQEKNLVTLWKEVDMGIGAVAKAYGYKIVLGFGDPLDKDVLHLFPNVNRKMQAMDLGSTVPLYIDKDIDISDIVVYNLNKWIEPKAVGTGPTK